MKKIILTKAQIMHLITGLVIVPLAGFIAQWVPQHFPGLPVFTSGELTAFFIAGAGSALSLGIHYLHGWQVWERTVGRVLDVEDTGTGIKVESKPENKPVPPRPKTTPPTSGSQSVTGV